MNQYDYQKELLQNRHPKYYQELIERKPYEFKAGEVKPIAYYLPQFHAFPENDEWWGKGFTEWTNVTKAMPQFEGHYQPHLAGELGYYDLMTDGVMERQIELAKMYGVYGFCFHFYMFDNRKRLLERPLNKFLANPNLDMPFCLCYANENWTRRWDGMENDVLMAQTYSDTFEADLANEMLTCLQDKRYITVDGKPLVIIYRINILPNPTEFASKFREECRKLGIGEIYLSSVLVGGVNDARGFGFDENIEFPLHQTAHFPIVEKVNIFSDDFSGHVFSYPHIVKTELDKQIAFPRLRGVMPSWDNEARKPSSGHSFHGSIPELYQAWLQGICQKTITERTESQRFVFINAWNEWAEGAHLEPDRRYGYAYLEATYQAVKNQHIAPNIDELDFNNLNSQQISIDDVAKYPENSHMQLFYYQHDEINVPDVRIEYFAGATQNKFSFTLDNISDLTHIRIDLTNFPVVANLEYVKLILADGVEHLLSPCYSNANLIEGNSYTYLHDDPINVYYLANLALEVQKIVVEIAVDLQPIKRSESLAVANQITAKQNEKIIQLESAFHQTQQQLQQSEQLVHQLNPWVHSVVALHYDIGNGFNGEHYLQQTAQVGINSYEFNVNEIVGIQGVRLDPLNLPAHIKLISAQVLAKDGSFYQLSIVWHNANHLIENRYSFYHDDPIWIFDWSQFSSLDYDKVMFEFELELIEVHELSNFVVQQLASLNIKETELSSTQTELFDVYNSGSWKITKPLRKLLSFVK